MTKIIFVKHTLNFHIFDFNLKTIIRLNINCQTVCFTDPTNNQLVKDEGAQIFYSIRSQTKLIGIGANCEIPHINKNSYNGSVNNNFFFI